MTLHNHGNFLGVFACSLAVLSFGCGGDSRGGGGGGGGGGGSGFLAGLDPAPLDTSDPEMIEAVAHMSAPNIFAQATVPMFAASLATDPELGGDPSCPTKTDNGDGTVTWQGGCTAADGKMWFGTATGPADPMGAPPSSGEIVLDGFGWEGASECTTTPGATERIVYEGATTFSRSGGSGLSFDVTLEITGDGIDDDCDEIAARVGIDYTGSTEMGDTAATWNGSGVIGFEHWGRYEIRTENEVVDDSVCESEAASGTTTVEAASDVVTITYDGATDCEDTSTVQWSLNGEPQGELQGVRCSVGRSGSAPAWLAALGIVALLRLRRRSRRA